jgi:hypothetical protein
VTAKIVKRYKDNKMAGKKRIVSAAYVSWPKPDFKAAVKTHKHFESNYRGAMMYAHYELSSGDLKKETIRYLRSLSPKHPLLERVMDMNDKRFTTVGKYMYVINHGGDIPEDILPSLIPALEKIIVEEEAKISAEAQEQASTIPTESKGNAAPITKAPPTPTIQDRLLEKAREVAGELEGWIDDFYLSKKTVQPKKVEEFVNLFKANDLKAPHMRHVQNIFSRRAVEIEKAATGKDKDLNEGYSNFTKAELRKFDTFHKNIMAACQMMQEVAKVQRAPRKKKPVSQEKLVERIKYKKEDTALGIVSQNPVQILGSKEVWVYNTKTRKLAQYKALDERGLLVKGASIINFSSESKEKTVRKPEDTLAEFKKASKVKLRTFMKDLSTVDVPAQGKLNENHVILRIDK